MVVSSAPSADTTLATIESGKEDKRILPKDYNALRTEGEMERDLETTSQLYLRGLSPSEIAAELVKLYGYKGLSAKQIEIDLAEIRKKWVRSALINYDEAKAREIAHIDTLEAAAWEAWNKSWGKTEVEVQEAIQDRWGFNDETPEETQKLESRKAYFRKRGTKTSKELKGDPRYLDTIKWCIEQRCKILGLHEPTRLAVTWQDEATKFGMSEQDAKNLFNRMVSMTSNALRDQLLANNEVTIPGNFVEGDFEDDDDDEPIDIE